MEAKKRRGPCRAPVIRRDFEKDKIDRETLNLRLLDSTYEDFMDRMCAIRFVADPKNMLDLKSVFGKTSPELPEVEAAIEVLTKFYDKINVIVDEIQREAHSLLANAASSNTDFGIYKKQLMEMGTNKMRKHGLSTNFDFFIYNRQQSMTAIQRLTHEPTF